MYEARSPGFRSTMVTMVETAVNFRFYLGSLIVYKCFWVSFQAQFTMICLALVQIDSYYSSTTSDVLHASPLVLIIEG